MRIEILKYLGNCKESREPTDKRLMRFLDFVKDGYSDVTSAETEPSTSLVLSGQPLLEHGLGLLKLVLENPLMGTVHRLEMQHCGLGARDFFVLVSAIGRNRDPDQGLQVLSMSHNLLFPPPDGEGSYQPLLALLTQENSCLEELCLENTGLDSKVLEHCLRKLHQTQEPVTARLKYLDLSNNLLGDAGAAALCELCDVMQNSLIAASLNGCFVGDPGMVLIAENWLAKFDSLRVLNLVGNEVGDQGAQAIGEILSKRHILKALDLSNNDLIKDTGAKALAHMAQRNQSLNKLFFLQHQLNEQGLTVLRLVYKYGVPELA
eukprot:g83230.t1